MMAFESHKLSSAEIRRRWREVLDEVQGNDESFLVIRAHKPVAVIIPYELWYAAKDHLELLDDSMDFRKKIAAYRIGMIEGTVERDPSWDRIVLDDIADGKLPPLPEALAKEAAEQVAKQRAERMAEGSIPA